MHNDGIDYQAKCKQLVFTAPKVAQNSQKYEYSVTILLRTKDRPLLLPRALASVMNQTYRDWQLVIINDGGNVDELEKGLFSFRKKYNDRLIVINHPQSLGMSRALNVGIDASSSEFIVVHDDDDSWHPEFLQETVKFLKNPENSDCGGVITHSVQVLEEMTTSQVIEKEKRDFNSMENPFTRVSLFRLLMQNSFPPISFLFRRSVVEKVGYFNEDLPVLNDWDFNIRCGFHFEIGVVPKLLANYHHRLNNQNSIYGNSIIATSGLCMQYETTIRNSALRTMINSNNHSEILGLCFALGGHYMQSWTVPTKIDFLLQGQNQSLSWMDQNIRSPLGTDLSMLQKQLTAIQLKLETIERKLNETAM